MSVVDIIEEAYQAEQGRDNPWENSPYKHLVQLSIDARGSVGENVISQALRENNDPNIDIIEDVSTVNKGGKDVHYDINVNNIKIEIKTSYMGAGNTWQHENLYKIACDMTIFLDFIYDGYYITVVPESLLPLGKDSEIFPRKHATLRKNKDDGYKLDFSRTTFKNLLKYNNKYTKFFNADASLKETGKFITERIKEY